MLFPAIFCFTCHGRSSCYATLLPVNACAVSHLLLHQPQPHLLSSAASVCVRTASSFRVLSSSEPMRASRCSYSAARRSQVAAASERTCASLLDMAACSSQDNERDGSGLHACVPQSLLLAHQLLPTGAAGPLLLLLLLPHLCLGHLTAGCVQLRLKVSTHGLQRSTVLRAKRAASCSQVHPVRAAHLEPCNRCTASAWQAKPHHVQLSCCLAVNIAHLL